MQVEAEMHDARFTYLGNKGYMPMLGYLFEHGICLHDEFREGNDLMPVSRIRKGQKIRLRGKTVSNHT